MGWKGHHTLHGNNQKFSGRTTENHEKEPEQMVFWAKKKKSNSEPPKYERGTRRNQLRLWCHRFEAFSTLEVTEHAAF